MMKKCSFYNALVLVSVIVHLNRKAVLFFHQVRADQPHPRRPSSIDQDLNHLSDLTQDMKTSVSVRCRTQVQPGPPVISRLHVPLRKMTLSVAAVLLQTMGRISVCVGMKRSDTHVCSFLSNKTQ